MSSTRKKSALQCPPRWEYVTLSSSLVHNATSRAALSMVFFTIFHHCSFFFAFMFSVSIVSTAFFPFLFRKSFCTHPFLCQRDWMMIARVPQCMLLLGPTILVSKLSVREGSFFCLSALGQHRRCFGIEFLHDSVPCKFLEVSGVFVVLLPA